MEEGSHGRSLDQDLNVHPDLASTLEDLSVDTLFASIGQELRKLHFRVTHRRPCRPEAIEASWKGQSPGCSFLTLGALS